ncbi:MULTISPECIES: bifunctional 2',3'-cyclic-nucleotide 2'-phosphodiesterase/3'-nucleotidase [unclassified Yoonia]|uniref:bifunctional 2',3'-cyclic-nucleotide 2'-phosphodiesterase/3'-nucleotidase n=1 Tax=unclassified Yoonia TaxID=2629118 RepID=UPI002B003024|nr:MULTISPECIES: bifunctional 2',3'-cyclic-nucleotide 2'-phosphodiesterase/3'-nucleotidase [unclassified Yoonia]
MNSAGDCLGSLRVLTTTDLHMQILPYDYFIDRPEAGAGLVQLADQISALQADPSALTLLFDNGDFLQGNPLADTVAQAPPSSAMHPMIAAFSALRYDAVGLGNHEFNYGLPFLRRAVQKAPFPLVCANIDWRDQAPIAQPFAILDRSIRCNDGCDHPIRIGVVGFVPPQVTQWDKVMLGDAIACRDIVEAAQDIVPHIKAAGADVVIALCHAGIGGTDHVQGMENAAVPLAAVPGIDVILTGHTHDIFPDPAGTTSAAVDPVAGRLHGKPAVGAGFHGHALGVITLALRRNANSWQITDSTSRIIPADPAPAKGKIASMIRAAAHSAHDATLRRIRQPVARTAVPIHSYFACTKPDLPGQILGDALIAHARTVLPDCDLPMVAAVSPIRAGGLAGPAHYVAIPPGPVAQRDICAIYPYADTPVVMRRTGAELLDWLEQAVSGYHRIKPGVADQPLLNPEFPAYVFDAFCGLTYAIDLTQPPRHDATGRIIAPEARRITDLCCDGRVVRPDDWFAVVATSYRTFGGGGFAPVPMHDVLAMPRTPIRDILTAAFQARQIIDAPVRPNWRFAPIPDTAAQFASAHEAGAHLTDGMTQQGASTGGFVRYSLAF